MKSNKIVRANYFVRNLNKTIEKTFRNLDEMIKWEGDMEYIEEMQIERKTSWDKLIVEDVTF